MKRQPAVAAALEEAVCPPRKKAAADGANVDSRRLCGNCGLRGHRAETCTAPCFACGGNHKYFACDHPELHADARRQASRNRVVWHGYGSVKKDRKGKPGMKSSGAGRFWARKEYDPEYTRQRDISPKRVALDKVPHASDRCRTSLRTLHEQEEAWAMEALMDGGFLTDFCIDNRGKDIHCPGRLMVHYHIGKDGQHNRKLYCVGTGNGSRHRYHWLHGSVLQGHTKLDAKD